MGKQKLSVHPGKLSGIEALSASVFEDNRGAFVKLYHRETWSALGIDGDYVESFVSISDPGVLRGLHFQLPPADHTKVVWVLSGTVMDVVVDLRQFSSTYREHEAFILSPYGAPNGICMPPGFAHGFYVQSGPASLLYMTTTMHKPELDSGVHWNSCGIPWPETDPVVSARDNSLGSLKDFDSPW